MQLVDRIEAKDLWKNNSWLQAIFETEVKVVKQFHRAIANKISVHKVKN